MKLNLSPLAIYTIGIMFFIPLVLLGLFWSYMPNNEEAQLYRDNLAKLQVEAGKASAANKRLELAMSLVKAKEQEWDATVLARTPGNSVQAHGINLAVNPFQLSVDTRKFLNNVQQAVNAQVKKGGVTVINGPTVPRIDPNVQASQLLQQVYNFPAIPFPVVIYDLGTVTVQGTYDQIMNNVRAYKTMPHYLAVTDGLRLDGTSPNLTGTYNLTIVGYIRGTNIYPTVPEGTTSAQGGPGSFPGGPGGGRPGGATGGPRAAGMMGAG